MRIVQRSVRIVQRSVKIVPRFVRMQQSSEGIVQTSVRI